MIQVKPFTTFDQYFSLSQAVCYQSGGGGGGGFRFALNVFFFSFTLCSLQKYGEDIYSLLYFNIKTRLGDIQLYLDRVTQILQRAPPLASLLLNNTQGGSR